MSYRFRATLCALSACVLSACGGGGSEWATVDPQADAFAAATPTENQFYVLQGSTEAVSSMTTLRGYTFSSSPPEFAELGNLLVGYIPMRSDAVTLNFGYVEGAPTKFFLSAEVPGSQTSYECISAAWSTEDKTVIQDAYGYVPATCESGVNYTPSSGLLLLDKANIPSADGKKLLLNVRTKMLPLEFPAHATGSGT
ncbi:MAG: hypothetical protein QM742_14120 [Aquabacterium sp.]